VNTTVKECVTTVTLLTSITVVSYERSLALKKRRRNLCRVTLWYDFFVWERMLDDSEKPCMMISRIFGGPYLLYIGRMNQRRSDQHVIKTWSLILHLVWSYPYPLLVCTNAGSADPGLILKIVLRLCANF